ncbi:zinc-dependent alcohol dehydrogenase family protein [Lentzea jiangxiensis]|uniref:NADPH:quinone reductase n=1 Tax=Lentzea jiangxiensis TaxID=641025 RepID=A0A1H0JR70_9PSEU|nr:NAD(P)-dependent alcohol dehydrogenase [Lentzea jiangxiensis]SDO46248.1 NADPH:quinone reductase [Lentzea jiangxiensis]
MTALRWVLPPDAVSADALRLHEVPLRQPGPGEVRVRVHAVSLNGRDQMVLRGPFGRIPGRELVPLSDVAGVVDAVGDGVAEFEVGAAVTNLHWQDAPVPTPPLGLGALDAPGVLASHVVLPVNQVVRAPAHLGHVESATLPCAGVTAWNALFGGREVAAGEKVASLGTGGVALYAMQLAKAAGADYFGVVRRASAERRLRDAGAAEVVNSADFPQWGARLREITGGVRNVVDTVGTATITDSLTALARQGEVALVGLFAREPLPLDPMLLFGSGGSLRGVAVGTAAQHRELIAFMERHDLRPVVDSVHEFGDAREAFAHHQRGGVVGKVVITVP